MARLQILSGKREGEFLELGAGVHQIGTRRAAEVQLRDKDIAYKHANLVVDGTGLHVEDLGSTKGVFVNGTALPENQKQKVRPKDKILVGSTELLVLTEDAVGAPAGEPPAPVEAGAASPSPAAAPPEAPSRPATPTAVAAEPAFRPPAPVLVTGSQQTASLSPGASAAASPPTTTGRADAARVAGPAGGDVALESELRELRARLAQKEQENQALNRALEGLHTHEGDEDEGAAGYMPAELSGDLEGRVVELQNQADELNARLLEKDQALKEREAEVKRDLAKLQAELTAERKKRAAVEKEVQRLLEAREGATGEDKKRVDELQEYEEANARLVLENDELKERVEGLRYQVELEAGRRGELVRERVRELHAENKKLEDANAELRSLGEAYEEKIDELDERLEELEGENEELERLLDEVRAELAKVKTERETMQKTLRQKTQRLEERLQELEGDNARARAAGERAARFSALDANGASSAELEDVGALRARLARLEGLFDDAETVAAAKALEDRVKELEGEAAGLRARLEKAPAPGDDLSQAVLAARARAEELEKRSRLDERKIERLEKKNRELVRANVAAEMAKADAERKAEGAGAARKA